MRKAEYEKDSRAKGANHIDTEKLMCNCKKKKEMRATLRWKGSI